ncbi:hypothetical protein LMG19083_04903 [Ralstonia psammae]|uniref:Uncharacterized protein n=1 Tax=Ralstonia psammae TaxID=3058598 RepID=A0ABM9JZE9_9RALS|nr:hypothetical protein LMG19083_04903 [Ralstonia sp. LMG 19083]
MNGRLTRWMAWALGVAGATLIFAAWLSPEGAFSFVTLASFCG